MGTRTYVNVSANRLLVDEPDLIADATLHSILTGESLTEHLIAASINSIAAQADEFLEYGRTTYVNGLPSSSSADLSINEPNVITTLNAVYPTAGTITLIGAVIDQSEAEYTVKQWLFENYNWKPSSTNLYAADGVTVVGTFTGFTANSSNITINANTGVLATLPAPSETTDHYKIKWVDSLDPTEHRFWQYDATVGTYPLLDLPPGVTFLSDFYPVIPLRSNGVSLNTTPTDPKYITGSGALDKLSIDMDELIASIDANPDIAFIDDAFFVMGVDIYSDRMEDAEYLYEVFKDMHTNGETVIRIREADYHVAISTESITSSTYTGTLGTSSGVPVTARTAYISGEFGFFTVRKQIAPNVVEVLTMNHLKMTTAIRIAGTYGQPDFDGRYVDRFLQSSNTVDFENTGFIIPLSFEAMSRLSVETQRTVLYRAMHVVVYAIQTIKLKWYQEGIFADLLKIAGIILAIYTAGASLVAAAAVSLTSLAITILKLVGIAQLTNYALEWLFENVGGIFAVLAAVAVVIALGGYRSGQSFFQLGNAEKLMKVVTSFTRVIETFTAFGLEQVQKEYGDFQSELETAEKALDEARDILGLNDDNVSTLLSLGTIREYVNFDESAEGFYNRTIHNGNPGVASLELVQGYADTMLRLPTPNLGDTLIGNINSFDGD